MSTATIEQLQRIVADESRTPEERRQAAEHILKLQEPAKEPAAPVPPVDPVLAERRSHFSEAQRRLADALAIGGDGFHLIDAGRSDVSVIRDKLVVMQIIRLMLDDDGNDGVLYAATGWSASKQTLADRMGDHALNSECDPQWRLGMQSPEKRRAYAKRQADLMKVNYVEPKPEMKLDAKTLVRMSSAEFAAFVVNFHRKVLDWDLKEYIYAELQTPAKEFFEGFVALQKQADAEEEELFKGAMAAHMLATDPKSDEKDAEDFLDILAWMGQRERLEAARRAERIAKQKPRSAREAKLDVAPLQAAEWTIREDKPRSVMLDSLL